MATTQDTQTVNDYIQFLRDYYHEELSTLAQRYPNDQRSIQIDYGDVYRFDPQTAYDYLKHPDQIRAYIEEAIVDFDLPDQTDLSGVHVRITGLPDEYTYYPDEFSPTKHHGTLRAIEGEISKATDTYARMEDAAFECQRCGTLIRIPQVDGEFQEPHECNGCDRQGPFEINYSESDFIDGQKLRIKTPPERAHGDGKAVDGFIEDDLCGQANVGDRVTINGTVELEQEGQRNPKNKFDPYIDIHTIEVEQTDAEDVDIAPEERDRIKTLAAGVEGDPLDIASQSLAPKIYGYDTPKKAIILALVGGSRTEYDSGGFDRGEFHILLIGDPSTAKSKLVNRAEQVGWRAVGVSGKTATVAGVTAAATQDDFSDAADWTLESGAFVKANKGIVAVDELDDMPKDVRGAMLEPMSKQYINVNKGGINTTLETRTGVIAAANPEHGRFDPYETISEQFVFGSTLLSRFDLVYTFKDVPDEEEDEQVADHVLSARDAAKRAEQDMEVSDESTVVNPPVQPDMLRKWIALAKQQPKPVFASAEVQEKIKESFTTLRGMHGYDPDEPVPVTFRSLEGIVRVSEAAAKFEFSDEITMRHVDIATSLVGQSMQDIGKDEDGKWDADTVETGKSKSQRERKKIVVETIQEMQREKEEGHVQREEVYTKLSEIDQGKLDHTMDNMLEQGEAICPNGSGSGTIRFIGSY